MNARLHARPLALAAWLLLSASCARAGEPPPAGPGSAPDRTAADPRSVDASPPDETKPGDGYLHLLLELTEDEAPRVVSATEVPGELVLSDYPLGPYHLEIRRGERIVAVEALADPFTARGFGGPPGTPEALHSTARQKAAAVVAKIPGAKLADLPFYALRLYRRLDPGVAIERVDPATQRRLLDEERLELVWTLTGQEIAAQLAAPRSEER